MSVSGEINGFVYISCKNCNNKKLYDIINFEKKKQIYNFFFCGLACESTFKLQNKHIIVKKINNRLLLEQNLKENLYELTGTINNSSYK